MKIIGGLALIAILSACGHHLTESEAVQNIRSSVEINQSASDGDIKTVMKNSCNLIDDLGVPLLVTTMGSQGYTLRESKVLLSNAAEVYCPDHLDEVKTIG